MAKKPRLKRTGQKQGSRFKKGQSGNPTGRPRGALNKATREAKAICNAIVDDPKYLKALKARMIDGDAGAMESIVWFYAKGKPKERVELGADKDLAQLVLEAAGLAKPTAARGLDDDEL